jgi:hypothetical protein
LLHQASIVYAAENWYIQELGIEGNHPKENYPDIDPEDLPESRTSSSSLPIGESSIFTNDGH